MVEKRFVVNIAGMEEIELTARQAFTLRDELTARLVDEPEPDNRDEVDI